jgi:hypothetical protein
MTPQSADIRIVTVVWGEWHLRAFLDVNLPTLLAPGNFPALFEKHRGVYRIYTRFKDVDRIRGAVAFQKLGALVPIELEIIEDESRLDRPIETHVEIWRTAIAQAAEHRALALLMPPDVLWSENSFAHVAELISQGKRAIYAAFFRVVSNTFLPAFWAMFGARPDRVIMTGNDLVALCLEHAHPIMAAHCRASRYFPRHPEMIVWPVPDEGLAVRVLARELLIYDPRRVQLNSAQLVTGAVPWDELHMIADSDHLFGVSLAPFGKDATWHQIPWQGTSREVARWWLDYDSPANDFVAGTEVRWHLRAPTERSWRQRKVGADLFIRRAALEREGLRVVAAALDDPAGRAIQVGRLLALLIATGRLARAMRGMPRMARRTIFVFVPVDDAVGSLRLPALMDAAATADGRIERLLRAHAAIAPEMVDLDSMGAAIELEFLDGSRRSLRCSARRRATIDGVEISWMERASTTLTICYVRHVLGAD